MEKVRSLREVDWLVRPRGIKASHKWIPMLSLASADVVVKILASRHFFNESRVLILLCRKSLLQIQVEFPSKSLSAITTSVETRRAISRQEWSFSCSDSFFDEGLLILWQFSDGNFDILDPSSSLDLVFSESLSLVDRMKSLLHVVLPMPESLAGVAIDVDCNLGGDFELHSLKVESGEKPVSLSSIFTVSGNFEDDLGIQFSMRTEQSLKLGSIEAVTVGGCIEAVTVGGCIEAVTVGGCIEAVTVGGCIEAATVGDCIGTITETKLSGQNWPKKKQHKVKFGQNRITKKQTSKAALFNLGYSKTTTRYTYMRPTGRNVIGLCKSDLLDFPSFFVAFLSNRIEWTRLSLLLLSPWFLSRSFCLFRFRNCFKELIADFRCTRIPVLNADPFSAIALAEWSDFNPDSSDYRQVCQHV
ncbi:hypothetical protein C0J52_24902 [Blattella germanica]|nr:hypothetical protein C0J52_24902 [Blattella germanica]